MKNFLFYFMCVDALSACMSVHHKHAGPEVAFNGPCLEFQHSGKRYRQIPSQPGLNREFQVSWVYTVRLSLCETGRGGGRGKSLVEGSRDGSKYYYCSLKSRFSFHVAPASGSGGQRCLWSPQTYAPTYRPTIHTQSFFKIFIFKSYNSSF